MAQRTQVVLISDLSGQEIPQGEGIALTFTINGISYELDATQAEAEQFNGTRGPGQDSARQAAVGRS